MKYTLKNYQKTTYEEIESHCKKYPGGTHGYIIDNILVALKRNVKDTRDYVYTKRILKDLKSFRVTSDYLNVQIVNEDASKSLKFSEQIIRTVKQNIK
jgi:hypothetical protein